MVLRYRHLDTPLENCFPTFTWVYKKFIRGKPDSFHYVKRDLYNNPFVEDLPGEREINNVGEPLDLFFTSLYGMLTPRVNWELTLKKHSGLDVNGYEIKEHRMDHGSRTAMIRIQTLKITSLEEVSKCSGRYAAD